MRQNLAVAADTFGRHVHQFRWLPPQAGSIAFPAWTGPGSVEALCQTALDREGLMIVPGSIFDYSGGYFRVGLGRRSFPEALGRLAQVVEAGEVAGKLQ